MFYIIKKISNFNTFLKMYKSICCAIHLSFGLFILKPLIHVSVKTAFKLQSKHFRKDTIWRKFQRRELNLYLRRFLIDRLHREKKI